ncbi:ABC transporter permease [Paenibacillus sp. N4]|uniref:ABC transporter permease n=1 Tax=Paenibacillus vietnamensis TaxID=2590547 RepID=UPI001CD0CEA2|nr:ABC transporter permease [Paenibacillus vietnamensis]MCA0756756.1 ABC transporter permease [Paenibacillus vietnamensis]
MTAVWALTWKELIRKRVTMMTAVMTVLFWIAYWFVAAAIASETNSIVTTGIQVNVLEKYTISAMVLTIGFFFGAFAVAFLSIFSSVSAVTGEAETGVLQSVLSRPIKRWHWFLGRWLGFVSYGVLYGIILFVTIILICKIETGVLFEGIVLLKSFALFVSVVPLLVSITMLGSCWLGPLGNGIGMTMLFGMGWLGSTIGRFMSESMIEREGIKTLETITGLIQLAMPADALQQRMLGELFSIAELSGLFNLNRAHSYFAIGAIPSNTFLVYSALYTAIMLLAGLLVLRKKDF